MTTALKKNYDTLSTDPRQTRPASYYLEKWKRRKGLGSERGGGRLEKFRRISRYKNVGPSDIVQGDIPHVFKSEYHFYRWNVGPLLCVYCGVKLDKHNKTQDHVIPRCRGGNKLGRENLEPACKDCNWDKGDDSLLMYLASRTKSP